MGRFVSDSHVILRRAFYCLAGNPGFNNEYIHCYVLREIATGIIIFHEQKLSYYENGIPRNLELDPPLDLFRWIEDIEEDLMSDED